MSRPKLNFNVSVDVDSLAESLLDILSDEGNMHELIEMIYDLASDRSFETLRYNVAMILTKMLEVDNDKE